MNSSLQIPPGYMAFGPAVAGCPGCFDFTLVFEESFLSIAPSVFILLAAPVRLFCLKDKKRAVNEQKFRLSKLGAIFALGALRLALLIVYALQPAQRAETTIAASVLSFISALLIGWLSFSEHLRSLRPSSVLGIYLFLCVLFDIARTRTIWLVNNSTVSAIFTAEFALEILVLILEAKGKASWVTAHEKQARSPEEFAGIYNRSFFWWLNSLIRNGFRSILSLGDLYPMDEAISSSVLNARFWKVWNRSTDEKWRLIRVLGRAYYWKLLAPVLPRLAYLAFTFSQPLLMSRFLDFLQQPDADINIGYGLIGAYAIVYFGLAVSNGIYLHANSRGVTSVRGALVSAIYDKTTRISITELDNSAAVTLMSTDVERTVNAMRQLHEVWASLIEVAIATWLLERQIGVASIAPIIVCIASVLLTGVVAGGAGPKQGAWVEKISARVGITAEVLSSMKSIKMSGLTQTLTSHIRRLRDEEISAGNGFRLVMVWAAALSFVPQLISPVLTFAIFVGVSIHNHAVLDVSRLFTSLSLILLLTQPLSGLFQSIPALLGAVACLGRIEKYLVTDIWQDSRLLPSNVVKPVSSNERTHAPEKSVQLQEMAKSTSSIDSGSESIVRVRSGNFGWKDKPDVLQNINFSVERNSLSVIIGPVASGKTTLLKALLGETSHLEGSVHVLSKEVSFCDQTPWIQNGTVQSNVIRFSNFNKDWYTTVLNAVALTEDLAVLPQGDQTIVGSKGITLSGGQKQRVALARAIYARKPLVILDDVFSGLDPKTHDQIIGYLFGPGGLLKSTTTIVATHSAKLLPLADNIIVLDTKGTISEQGTYSELAQAGGYVQVTVQEDTESKEKAAEQQASEELEAIAKDSKTQKPASQEEEQTRKDGDVADYFYYLKSVGWSSAFIFLTLEVLFSFLMVFPSAWLKWWTDATNAGNPDTGLYMGVYAALQVLGVLIIIVLCWYTLNIMIRQSGSYLHDVLINTVMNAPMSFFHRTDVGVTTNRFSQDLELIDGELPDAILNLFVVAFTVIGQAVLIATASYYIAITFPFIIVIFWFIQRYYLRTSRQLRLMDLEAKSPLYTQFLESLSGLATIRAFGWTEDNKQLNKELLDASQKPFYLLFMIQRWLGLVLDLVVMGLAVVVVGLSTGLRDSVSPGFAGVSLVNLISFTTYIKGLVTVWTITETSIGAVSRIRTISEQVKSENLPGEDSQPSASETWPLGDIIFDDVKASYDETEETNALDGVSLSIKAGQKVGVCGRSGSGKSTLVSTLFRLIELKSGRIIIDGYDLATLPRQYVRSHIIGVPQDALLLSGTVRFNVDPFKQSTDEAIIQALKKVAIWEVFEENGGLDADMKTESLSHGQRQLFSLARAILRPGKIVMLDEATSSVDKATDDLMQQIIRDEFKDRTIIAITHRLETVLDFDIVVVMDKGRVVEYGGPSALLEKESLFKELYRKS